MTISSLSGILALIQILVESDDGQVPVVTSFRKQVVDACIFASGRHQVVQHDDISDGRIKEVVSFQTWGNTSVKLDTGIHVISHLVVERLPPSTQPQYSVRGRFDS